MPSEAWKPKKHHGKLQGRQFVRENVADFESLTRQSFQCADNAHLIVRLGVRAFFVGIIDDAEGDFGFFGEVVLTEAQPLKRFSQVVGHLTGCSRATMHPFFGFRGRQGYLVQMVGCVFFSRLSLFHRQ